MPRQTNQSRRERIRKIIAALQRTYPQAHCELNYTNPLELLIATILSAQCTDKQVNLVTPDLFKKFRRADAYAVCNVEDLQRAIQRLGFFRNKAKNIQACCRDIRDKHDGVVPKTMDELT